MLTYEDEPTIRNAIMKRLDVERGIKICELRILPALKAVPPYLRVIIETLLDEAFTCVSTFDLPDCADIRHVHNEIDEIAEQLKKARIDRFFNGAAENGVMRTILGTGQRGRWAAYG